MTQSRRKKPPEAIPDPVPSPPPPLLMTSSQLTALGLDASTADVVLKDANQVYAQIEALGNQNRPVTQDMLVQWAAATWKAGPTSPVDRLSAALAVLHKMGLVFRVG